MHCVELLTADLHEAVACPQDEVLKAAFRPYGNVQNVKVIREKGGKYGTIGGVWQLCHS